MPGDTLPPSMGGWGADLADAPSSLPTDGPMEPTPADLERLAAAREAEEKLKAVEVKEREERAIPLPPSPGDLIRNLVDGLEARIEQLTAELSAERKANRELVEDLEAIRGDA